MKASKFFKALLGIGTAAAAGFAVKKAIDKKKEQEEIKRFIELDEDAENYEDVYVAPQTEDAEIAEEPEDNAEPAEQTEAAE